MIRFENVTKYFGSKRVLDDVSYTVEKGEVFVIVGHSGAGKSVSLKHMVRLLTPDEGKIWIGDDLVSKARGHDLERIRLRFGVLFQSAALLEWKTVGENVALPLEEHTDMRTPQIWEKVVQYLGMVGLEDAVHKLPSELSGGMRKRVGLARAIVMNPDIVLYDEPTSGLDPVTSRTIDDLIFKMNRELGVTSVVVTHDLHSALAIGTKIGMLYQGKLVEILPPDRFIESEHPVVKDFLSAQYITREGSWVKKD